MKKKKKNNIQTKQTETDTKWQQMPGMAMKKQKQTGVNFGTTKKH